MTTGSRMMERELEQRKALLPVDMVMPSESGQIGGDQAHAHIVPISMHLSEVTLTHTHEPIAPFMIPRLCGGVLDDGMRESRSGREGLRPGDMVIPSESGRIGEDQVRLPLNKNGLKLAVLNSERYGAHNVRRHLAAGKVVVPQRWKDEMNSVAQPPSGDTDYTALMRKIEEMDIAEFANTDVDKLVQQFTN
eukprot:gene31488-6674_t